MEDSVISGKDFELYANMFEAFMKDFSQSHDYSIRLHFRALTPASVWWISGLGGWSLESAETKIIESQIIEAAGKQPQEIFVWNK